MTLTRIKEIVWQAITEPNNQTACPIRILGVIGVLQYLAITATHYIQHAVFETQGFAVGFAAILGGVGAALGMKKDSPKE